MQVLLDTDVVLDVLLDRVSFAQDLRAIWNACAHNQLVGYINSITPINVSYILRKAIGIPRARAGVADLITLFQVCFVDRAVLQAAYALSMNDFEDAAQVAAAQAAGLDALVTRNTSDYANAPLLVPTPPDLVKQLPIP